MTSPFLTPVLAGLVLGWSIAWPPGPINAEMIRRGLSRGFWQAWAVGLGACSGDFLWALGVALGAGAVIDRPAIRTVLGVVSIALLLLLAWAFGKGALEAARRHRHHEPEPPPKALDSTRGGWLLGFGMALSSPWNLAFWLAVMGQQGKTSLGLTGSLLLAAAVVVGAAAWGLVLCSSVRAGARFAGPAWSIATPALTAALMIGFAVRSTIRLVG